MNSTNSFRCFQHPNKFVEAICVEPSCNNYRFFCVTCFLENSSHFIYHKESICELGEVLSNSVQLQQSKMDVYDQNEMEQNLSKISLLMKEYDQMIKQKKQGYSQVFRQLDQKFQEWKMKSQLELEQQIDDLNQKQHQHFQQLRKKIEIFKRENIIDDWKQIRKKDQMEITSFFENLIKRPMMQDHGDFRKEIRYHLQHIQKNLQELESLSANQKALGQVVSEFQEQIGERFTEIRDILGLDAHSQQIQQLQQLQFQQPLQKKTATRTLGDDLLKQFKTPQSDQLIHPNQSAMQNHLNPGLGLNSSGFNLRNNSSIIINNTSVARGLEDSSLFQKSKQQLNELSNFLLKKPNTTTTASTTVLNRNGVARGARNYQYLSDSGIEIESDLDEALAQNPQIDARLKNQFQQNRKLHNQYLMDEESSKNQLEGENNYLRTNNTATTHQDGITAIIFYESTVKNKHIIATGSLDCNIKLWHLEQNNFELIKTLVGHNHPINHLLKFHRDNTNFLVSSSQSHEIKIWNPSLSEGNELVTTLLGHMSSVGCVMLFENFLLSGSKDKTIKVWDLNELKCVETLQQAESADYMGIYQNQQNQTNQLISNCGDGFRIYTYKQNGQFQLKSYNAQAHRCGLSFLKVIRSEEVDMVTSGRDGIIKLWNILKGQCIGTLQGHTSVIYNIKWIEDKGLLLSASLDGNLKIWNLKDEIKSVQTNHCLNKEQTPHGDFLVLEEFSCILSVSNGNNFIKIIYV